MSKVFTCEAKAQKDFEKIIKDIHPILNKVHNCKKSKYYWTLILFHWLKGFLVYYNQHKKKKYQFHNSNFIFKIKDSKFSLDKLDSNDSIFHSQFNKLINIDDCDLSLFKFEYYSLYYENFSKNSITFLVKKFLWIVFSFIFKINFYSNLFLSKSIIYKVFFETRFKLFTLLNLQSFFFKKKNECDLRQKFKKEISNLTKNSSVNYRNILQLVAFFLPVTYLENYESILKKNKLVIKFKPKKIFVDGEHIKNDQIQIIIAEWKLKDSKLYSIQHAANDVNFEKNSFNFYNKAYVDKFISWGSYRSKVISLPSLRLFSNIKSIKRQKSKIYNIIFLPRGIRYFPSSSYHYDISLHKNYLNSEKKLISEIKKNNKFKLAIKYKNLSMKKIDSNNKNIFFTNIKTTDLYNLGDLVIFNHLSTGFIECIFANIPSILYMPKKDYLFKESSSLKELESLFLRYNLIYDNPKYILDLFKKKKMGNIIYFSIVKIKNDPIFKKYFKDPNKSISNWKSFLK